jgi:hypothetical protein
VGGQDQFTGVGAGDGGSKGEGVEDEGGQSQE